MLASLKSLLAAARKLTADAARSVPGSQMGANWCNTMQLYESLPETATLAHAGSPWHIFAVEAAPLIQPYVERCVAALAAGQPLPVPPVPPAGSSMQLLNYANDLGCSAEKVGRGRRERMNCVAAALKERSAAHARRP